MTQNKYDDPAFFEKYSQMSRSKNGLEVQENGMYYNEFYLILQIKQYWI